MYSFQSILENTIIKGDQINDLTKELSFEVFHYFS